MVGCRKKYPLSWASSAVFLQLTKQHRHTLGFQCWCWGFIFCKHRTRLLCLPLSPWYGPFMTFNLMKAYYQPHPALHPLERKWSRPQFRPSQLRTLCYTYLMPHLSHTVDTSMPSFHFELSFESDSVHKSAVRATEQVASTSECQPPVRLKEKVFSKMNPNGQPVWNSHSLPFFKEFYEFPLFTDFKCLHISRVFPKSDVDVCLTFTDKDETAHFKVDSILIYSLINLCNISRYGLWTIKQIIISRDMLRRNTYGLAGSLLLVQDQCKEKSMDKLWRDC